MWMSNLYIMVNRDNADHNSLSDLSAAIRETGATLVSVDEQNHLIEAVCPAGEVSTISAMEGVSYVRSSFNYFVDDQPREAA